MSYNGVCLLKYPANSTKWPFLQQPIYTFNMLLSQLSVAQALQNKAKIPNVVAAIEYSVSRLSKWHLYPPCLVVSTIVIYWNWLNKNSCASHGKLSFNTCLSTCMQQCGP